MDGVQLPKVNRATTRTQFTFYHEAPRNSWYLFNKTQKMKGWVVLEATSGFQHRTIGLGIQRLNQ